MLCYALNNYLLDFTPSYLLLFLIAMQNDRTGSLSGAINLPANQFLELGLVPAHPALDLAKQKGSVIAVLGREKGDEMLQV